MRILVSAFIVLTLLSALIGTSAGTANSAPPPTFVNLTKDRAVERNPSIGWSLNGDVIVAWEQDAYTNGTVQQDVFARVLQIGRFGPAVNISINSAQSREPSIFGVGQVASVLYQETSPGGSYIARSDWSGAAWSAPQNIAGGDYVMSLNPVGVQASDGSIWLARWVRTVGSHSDIVVQQIGGSAFNVSNDGGAWRHPALAAGNSGEVYVAWIDHTYKPSGAVPGVRVAKVTPGGIVALPQPSTDYFAYWPSLVYRGGQLYSSWLGTTVRLIRERVWNGSAWARTRTLTTGDTPRLAVTAGGNVFVAFENNGQIFLKKNSATPLLVSGSLSKAGQPALTVDGSGNAHVAFIAGGDVWYVRVPSQ